MKLIIRDYLASLKERGELDAILPDLLSELGFTVYSRPGRGTRQHGVDIAAVGEDDDGERKVFLFSVKQGDLARQDWDGTPQGLRSSLNEILDVYVPTRIPNRYQRLKIVICICIGGEIQEQVRSAVSGYIRTNSTNKISFDEWNGDKLAGLLVHGILREEILPKPLRSSFQKSVAMVDEPDVAYHYFAELVQKLRKVAEEDRKAATRVSRQLYFCLWVLFVWARDVENVEAPYRVSELVLLNVWNFVRSFIGKRTSDAKAIFRVLHQLIQLHLLIASEMLERKVLPHVGKPHAISTVIEGRSSTDVNLKLFDLLGRIAMTGLWLHWLVEKRGASLAEETKNKIDEWAISGFKLIQNNSALLSPLCDQHGIEIALFLLLAVTVEGGWDNLSNWLQHMVGRLNIAVRTHGKYPSVFTDYRDLVGHPRERSEEYLKEATSGSILIPLLAAWLCALGEKEAVDKLVQLKRTVLAHCTLQLWLPDRGTEDALYVGGRDHGVALCDLPLMGDGGTLLDTVVEACKKEESFTELSANRTGFWPIILLACRHHRHPVPPQFWIDILRPRQ